MKYRIPDIKHYTCEMAKAVQDKVWFLDYIWVNSMVDIGTADAAVPFHILGNVNKNLRGEIFEPCKNLFWEAERKVYGSDLKAFNDIDSFYAAMKERRPYDLCLLSSVFHEIYSDNRYTPLSKVFNAIRISEARYVAVRDMHLSESFSSTPKHISEAIINFVKENPEQRERFDQYNSKNHISRPENAIQYLLKYRYIVNWEHEIKENYFAMNLDQVKEAMTLYGYEVFFERGFTPDFIANDIQENFGIDIPSTHVEIIFEKKI